MPDDSPTPMEIATSASTIADAIERFIQPYQQLPDALRTLRKIGTMENALREAQTRIDAAWAEAQRREVEIAEGHAAYLQTIGEQRARAEAQQQKLQILVTETEERLRMREAELQDAQRQLAEVEASTAARVAAAESRVAEAQAKLRQLLGTGA